MNLFIYLNFMHKNCNVPFNYQTKLKETSRDKSIVAWSWVLNTTPTTWHTTMPTQTRYNSNKGCRV